MMPEDGDFRLQRDLDEIRAGCLNRLWWALKERWLHGNRYEADKHLLMSICRMTDTGPYVPGGQYDHSHSGWRDSELDHRQIDWRRRAMPRSAPAIAVHVAPIAEAASIPD